MAFVSNFLNRITLTHLLRMEPDVMGPVRSLIKYAARIRKGGREPPPVRGASAVLRPHSRYYISFSLRWALRNTEIARALAYWEHVVDFHLCGRFLPSDLW